MNILCSRCGTSKKFRYSAGNVLCTVYTQGWRSYGSALYCPECASTWDERNKDRPLPGPEATVSLIDYYHLSSKRKCHL